MNLIKKVLILLVCLSVQSKVLPAAAAVPAKEVAIAAALEEARKKAEAPMRERNSDVRKRLKQCIINELNKITGFETMLRANDIDLNNILDNINSPIFIEFGINLFQHVMTMCSAEPNLPIIVKLLLDLGANPHFSIPDNIATRNSLYKKYIYLNILEIAQIIQSPALEIIKNWFEERCVNCCLNEKLKPCSGCKKVKYCSQECQKKDWAVHKQRCLFSKAQDLMLFINTISKSYIDAAMEFLFVPINNFYDIDKAFVLKNKEKKIFDLYAKKIDDLNQYLSKKIYIKHKIQICGLIRAHNKIMKEMLSFFNKKTDEISDFIAKNKAGKAIVKDTPNATKNKKSKTFEATSTTAQLPTCAFPAKFLTYSEIKTLDEIVDNSIKAEVDAWNKEASSGNMPSATAAASVTPVIMPTEELTPEEDDGKDWILVTGKKEKKKVTHTPVPSPVVPASRQSTQRGTLEATDLMAIWQARIYPEDGMILDIKMEDERWPYHGGWRKMRQPILILDRIIEVHYVFNIISMKYDDFKVKKA